MNIFMKSIKIPPAEEYEVEDLEILSSSCKKLIRSVGIPAEEAAENMDTLLQCLYFDTRKLPTTSAEVKQSMKAFRKKQRALGLPVIHRHHRHRNGNKDNKDNNEDNNKGVEEAGDESDEGSTDSLSSGSSSSSSIERVDVEPLKVKQEKQQEKEKGKKNKKEKEGGKAKGKKDKGKDKGKDKKGKKSKETKNEKKKRKAPEKEGNESAESSSPSVPSKKKREAKKEKGESNLSLSKKKKKTKENSTEEQQQQQEEKHKKGGKRNGGKRMSCCIDLGAAASSDSMKPSVSFPSTASSCITTTTTTTRPRSPSAIERVTPQDPTLQLAPQQRSFSAKTSSELRDTSALDTINKEQSVSLTSSARATSLSPRGFELTSEMKELFIMENPSPLFSNKARIGKGGFGEVFTGKDKANGQTVAIKVLRRTLSDDKAVVKEIEMLRSCHHPHIVNYLRSYLYKDKISMVMEYCDGGSLQKLLSSIDLNEGQMSLLCKGILSALDYLHSQNRIHRDIKSDNILLNMNGIVKVADLGLCAELDGEEDSKNSVAGSRNWMAPEMIKRVHYGCKVDIWSLGAVLLEMMEKHPPYNNLRPLRVIFNTATKGAPPLKKPKKWSNELKDFLSRCFEMDPDKRPSAAELLQHDFITKKAAPNSKLVQAIGIVFLGNSIRMNGF